MKKHILFMGVVGLAALSTLAQAETKQPVAKWTCADFLAVDESFQPTAVGLGEAINKKPCWMLTVSPKSHRWW